MGDADLLRRIQQGVSPFRLVVFDLDGTLVDSRRDLAEAANAVLEEHGCRPHEEEAIGRMVGDGAATLVARAFAAAGCPEPAGALPRFLQVYNARLLGSTRPYPGIEGLLEGAHTRATLAVLTNKPLGPTHEILDGLGLTRSFGGRVIGGDGPFPRKPDPQGLRHLMAVAGGKPSDTLMVGDSSIDWQTARGAGCRMCLARYGFGAEGFRLEQLAIDDASIDRPLDLLPML
jgi:phosphoglycolate phosphatase